MRWASGVTKIRHCAVAALSHRRRGGEGDASGLDIAAEHGAGVIVPHLADIAGGAAEPRHAHHRVGGGAAADLDRLAHARAECLGTLGVDQSHRALRQVLFGEQRVIGLGHGIDDGVADPDDIQLRPHSTLPHRDNAAGATAAGL